MEELFGRLVFVYLDDVLLAASESWEEHIKHLDIVLDRIRYSGPKLKPQKCHFCLEEISFLDYLSTPTGLKMDSAKVKVVQNRSENQEGCSLIFGIFGTL